MDQEIIETGQGIETGRRERRRVETHERLFRAALKLFAEKGFAATTVEDITETADVGKGTFFNYFPSKEHVLAAFGDMQMNKARAVIAQAKPGEPPRDVMHRVLHKLAEEPGRSPALVRSLLGGHLSQELVRCMVCEHLNRGLEFFDSLIAEAQRRGQIRTDRPSAILARYFFQVYFGTLLHWTLFPDESLVDRLDTAFDLTWAAVSSESGSRAT